MKILGEKSLASKVEATLEILFIIIALIDIAVVGIIGISFLSDYIRYELSIRTLKQLIIITITEVIFLLTGVVALYIIYQFIKIFNNLKNSKFFEKDNVKLLNKISTLSVIIGILYLVCLIGISVVLGNYISFDLLSNVLIKVLILIFAVAFLIFGIGIRILNEIYKKAIEYKEENDFTI